MDNSSERVPPNDSPAQYNNVGNDNDNGNYVGNDNGNYVSNDNDHTAENTGIMPSPSHKPVTPSLSSKSITKSPECTILICDMKIYENRLKTFKKWPSKCITPEKLARAGFYYTGMQDKVRCLYCPNEFEYWGKDDDPYTEHKLASPQCQYFKEKLDHKSDVMTTFVQNFLRSVGIVTDMNMKVLSNYKALTSLESRKKTFEAFTKKLTHDVQTFCKAGLFYIGENDRMLCFCCNQGLMDWEVDDDPWVEHARWSPLCSYVLLSKGKRFVEEVGGEVNYSLRINLEELNKLFTIHRQLAVDSDTMRNLETLTESNTFMDFLEPITIMRVSQREPSAPDSVLCKICFKEKLEVLFMPCGHVIACIQCAVTLDVCAVCRQPFTLTMRVGLYVTNLKEFSLEYFPSKCSDELIDPVLCKVCCKEEMQAVFLPCRHISTCFKCAPKINQCVVCFEPIYAYMQVFL
ncbi:death-associated inhibitor of apoptosis 2-like [Myzus persicae]|uniref:death-associated inhibitor of apoptosis 2-like n=1 Tax=Myzus persicae TaxID=13164 RepID=UPI000B934ACA|nr:death-associated inhibitor of apoptosis 2-like [Myzus persicae]